MSAIVRHVCPSCRMGFYAPGEQGTRFCSDACADRGAAPASPASKTPRATGPELTDEAIRAIEIPKRGETVHHDGVLLIRVSSAGRKRLFDQQTREFLGYWPKLSARSARRRASLSR